MAAALSLIVPYLGALGARLKQRRQRLECRLLQRLLRQRHVGHLLGHVQVEAVRLQHLALNRLQHVPELGYNL